MDIGEFREDDIGFSIGGGDMPESRIGHAIHGGQPNDWLGEGLPKRGNGLMGMSHRKCEEIGCLSSKTDLPKK